jgi:hypothetical protein
LANKEILDTIWEDVVDGNDIAGENAVDKAAMAIRILKHMENERTLLDIIIVVASGFRRRNDVTQRNVVVT